MNESSGAAGSVAIRACARAAAFLVLWLVLAGADVADLPAAAVAVVAATWARAVCNFASSRHHSALDQAPRRTYELVSQ